MAHKRTPKEQDTFLRIQVARNLLLDDIPIYVWEVLKTEWRHYCTHPNLYADNTDINKAVRNYINGLLKWQINISYNL